MDMPSADSVRTMASNRSVSDLGQRRRRLVHEDDPGVARQRPSDGHDLALGYCETAQRRIDVEFGAEPCQKLARYFAHAGMFDQPRRAAEHSTDADILGHSHLGKQCQILPDDLNAGGARRGGRH